MGEAENPWATLRARPDVVLSYGWLRGAEGRVRDHGAFYEITLHCNLGRVARRCVLLHELVHIERGFEVLYDRSTPRLLIDKAEAIVNREVARRLVPVDDLAAFVLMLVDSGEAVGVHDVAGEFDVTEQVALTAMELLRQELMQRAS